MLTKFNFNSSSLIVKFILKVFSGSISILSAFVVQTLFIKRVGISGYGTYSYVFSYLTQLFVFLDFGINNFFYTHTVNYFNRRKIILSVYLFFNLIIISISFFFFIIIYNLNILKLELFGGNKLIYFIIIFFIVALNKLTLIFSLYNDSSGNTSKSEMKILYSRLFSLLPFIFLYYFGNLTLFIFIIWVLFQSLIILLSLILTYKIKLRSNFYKKFILNFFLFLKQASKYSTPLFFSSIISFLINFLDRYLVLKNGNSSLQGYFNYSFQLSNLIIFITSSLVFLLIRDFTLSNKISLEILKDKFQKFTPILFYITVVFAFYFIFNIKFLVSLFLNNDNGFDNLLLLFFLYPIHQILGQLASGLLISTNKTLVFLHSSILQIILSLIFYILIMNFNSLKYNVAELVAIKILTINLIITLFQLKKVYNYLKLNYNHFFFQHLIVIISVYIIGYFTFKFFTYSNITFFNFLISSFLFFNFISLQAYLFKNYFGINNKFLENF